MSTTPSNDAMAADRAASEKGGVRDDEPATVATTTLTTTTTTASPPDPGRPILWAPAAWAVSAGANTALGAVRTTRAIGALPLGATKFAVLASMELGRLALEGVLGLAGRDVYARALSDAGRAQAGSVVGSVFDALHRGATYAQLLAAAGFETVGRGLASAADLAELALGLLDGLLGSTESSRALRSIGAFLIREFQNPATGRPGERVAALDLVFALVSLVYLQSACRHLDDRERAHLGVDEIIWDIVVRHGRRVDLNQYDDNDADTAANNTNNTNIKKRKNTEAEEESVETRLRRQVIAAVPAHARVASSTSHATTVTIDVAGSEPPRLDLLPLGVELVEVNRLPPSENTLLDPRPDDAGAGADADADANSEPVFRIVFQFTRDVLRGTPPAYGPGAGLDAMPGFIQQVDADDESGDEGTEEHEKAVEDDPVPELPPPPPVPPKPREITARQSSLSAFGAVAVSGSSIPGPTSPPSRANQSRPRLPLSPPPPPPPRKPQLPPAPPRRPPAAKAAPAAAPAAAAASARAAKPPEKKGGFRSAFRKGPGPAISSLLHKEESSSAPQPAGRRKPTSSSSNRESHLPVPQRTVSFTPKRDAPRAPRPVPTPLTHRALHNHHHHAPPPDDKPQASPVPALSLPPTPRRRRLSEGTDRDSVISVTDSIEVQSIHTRRRAQRETPSIYTLKTNDSQSSLAMPSYYHYHRWDKDPDSAALASLRRTGMADGMFPALPLLHNLSRYMRFSSAAYGRQFLQTMGMTGAAERHMAVRIHDLDGDGGGRNISDEARAFAHHTGIRPADVLVTSFTDAHGGADSTGSTARGTSLPLVHYISLDREAHAVVLACRGTLGFEDVLADMACEYDDLAWGAGADARVYKVHKGVLASARRLLYGRDGRVLAALRDALEDNPGYGLVLCGHSLGGAVTALLGLLLAEPASQFATQQQQQQPGGPLFVTRSTTDDDNVSDSGITAASDSGSAARLPPGRPIHVFAYGAPGTMSAGLRRRTRGLVTSVVHGADMVPYLSVGVLHDFQAVALAFRTDDTGAAAEFWRRLWLALRDSLLPVSLSSSAALSSSNTSSDGSPSALPHGHDAEWALASLKTLRATMLSQKLLPPGDVLVVETSAVLRRDVFVGAGTNKDNVGSGDGGSSTSSLLTVHDARRVVLKYVRDAETRFSEMRFGVGVLTDHNPARYEDALDTLRSGVAI